MICVGEFASRNYGENKEYPAEGENNNFLRGGITKLQKLVENVESNISPLSHQYWFLKILLIWNSSFSLCNRRLHFQNGHLTYC